MTTGNIERLIALLRTDEEGDDIALLINEFLIDDRKKNTLLVRLKEVKEEVEMYKTGTLSETDAATVSAHAGMGGGQSGGIGRSKGLDKQHPTTSQAPSQIKRGQ